MSGGGVLQRNCTVVLLGWAVSAFAVAAAADTRQYRNAGSGMVKATSKYGVETITAPVRRGRLGPEVRLPGGTWLNCAGDCQDTLREETVDFFYKLQERSGSKSRR